MENFKNWCTSDTATARMTRTIAQGIIGVIVANLDLIIGGFTIDPAYKPMVVALVMAVLAPIQKSLGGDAHE